MTLLAATLQQIGAELERQGRAWALVGGLAVSARAAPRTTRDVDVAVAVADDEEAEQVAFSLSQAGYRILQVLEHAQTGRLATVRAEPPGGRTIVDLLFASSGIEPEVVRSAERLTVFPGLTVPVASIAHLIALKVLARDDRQRPQDWDDLSALLARSGPDVLVEARAALREIVARGYARGKDLEAELGLLLATRR